MKLGNLCRSISQFNFIKSTSQVDKQRLLFVLNCRSSRLSYCQMRNKLNGKPVRTFYISQKYNRPMSNLLVGISDCIEYVLSKATLKIVFVAGICGCLIDIFDRPKPVYAGGVNFFASVVAKVSPAVVFLEIKDRTNKEKVIANGSGFVVQRNGLNGLILTNAHVLGKASTSIVEVILQDGRVYEGQVVAIDPICDLGAVQIKAWNLKSISIDSSEPKPGEWVAAFGSPLALSKTVTCGIVSNVQRQSGEIGLRHKNMDYIQTDAVINFGSSGGPLVNLNGNVVGINCMKLHTGLSFAIPSWYISKFLDKTKELMRKGKTENGFESRRYMGITMLTLTKALLRDQARDLGLSVNARVQGGVYVYSVLPGTPADLGGLQPHDVIIAINGRPVLCAADVYHNVEHAVEWLVVTVLRAGRQTTVRLNARPD